MPASAPSKRATSPIASPTHSPRMPSSSLSCSCSSPPPSCAALVPTMSLRTPVSGTSSPILRLPPLPAAKSWMPSSPSASLSAVHPSRLPPLPASPSTPSPRPGGQPAGVPASSHFPSSPYACSLPSRHRLLQYLRCLLLPRCISTSSRFCTGGRAGLSGSLRPSMLQPGASN